MDDQVLALLRFCIFHSTKYSRPIKRDDIKEKLPSIKSEDLGRLLDHTRDHLESVFGLTLIEAVSATTPAVASTMKRRAVAAINPEDASINENNDDTLDSTASLWSTPRRPLSETLNAQSSWYLVSNLTSHPDLRAALLATSFKDEYDESSASLSEPGHFIAFLMMTLALLAAEKEHFVEREALISHLSYLLGQIPGFPLPVSTANVEELLDYGVKKGYLVKRVPSKQDPAVLYGWGRRAMAMLPMERLRAFIKSLCPQLVDTDFDRICCNLYSIPGS